MPAAEWNMIKKLLMSLGLVSVLIFCFGLGVFCGHAILVDNVSSAHKLNIYLSW